MASSASLHIYNVQIKGAQHKAMVKPALKAEGYTSWPTYSLQAIDVLKETIMG